MMAAVETKKSPLLMPPSVENSFSSSASGSVEGSIPSDSSAKTSPGGSPAHRSRINRVSLIPKIQTPTPPSCLPPKTSCPGGKNRDAKRLSLGKPISMKEIRSCSVGHPSSKDDLINEDPLQVKRRNGKTNGSNGHVRSSSLSNGRDRLSLYAPSLSEESCLERNEAGDLMSHSLTMGNNNERLIRNRKPLVQKSAEKKARKVKFYRNGDRFFKGVTLAVSAERYRTFDALLSELNRLVGDRVNLHHGVRVLFTLDGSKVSGVDELQDGESYVCASSDAFKKLEYQKCGAEQGPQQRSRITSGKVIICREAPMISGLDHWKERRRKNQANNNGAVAAPSNGESSPRSGNETQWTEQMKPRLITIIRNGCRPRKAVRMLLNKKTAHSYDQVLTDITEQIRPDSGAVRKLFTLDGRQVTSLADFFGQDFVFIAYGNEKFSHDDFDLTSNEVKFLPPFAARSPMNARRGAKVTGTRPASSHVRSGSHGRSCDVAVSSPGSRDSSLPRCYVNEQFDDSHSAEESAAEDPRSQVAASNQLVVEVPVVVEVRFDVGRIIGDGNFAVVRQGVDRRAGGRFALKLIDKKRCQGKEVVLESEVQVLSRLRHPNVVKLYDVIDAGSILCLVLELVEGGDLFDAIAAAGKFSEPEARRMTLDLASALDYLHSLSIVHRDVKPENLFVVNLPDGMHSLKLGDFGLAQEVTDEMLFTVCGTPTYVAPEILLETGYGLKVDVWAMGVILFILLCGYPPFVSPTNDQEELFDAILAGTFEFASPYWDDASESAKDLITLMLHVDPELRFSAAQVLQHPWITDDDDDPWPDLQQCRKLGLHFDVESLMKGAVSGGTSSGDHLSSSSSCLSSSLTTISTSPGTLPAGGGGTALKKAPKSLVAAESTPCLHSLQVL